MTHSELLKLHELKGRLEARLTILNSDIDFTTCLAEAMVSDHYNGYTRGKVEAYQEWLRDTNRILAAISQLIEEAENARE